MANLVEFIGASGIGKSHLRAKLLHARHNTHIMSFERAATLSTQNRSLLKELLFNTPESIHNRNWFNQLMGIRGEHVESFYRDNAVGNTTAHLYTKTLDFSLQYLFNSERPLDMKLRILNYLKHLLYKHYLIKTKFSLEQSVLMDEGLVMNVRGLDQVAFSQVPYIVELMPQFVIHCVAPTAIAIPRYLSRANAAGKKVTDNDAQNTFIITSKRAEILSGKLAEIGVPIHKVDLSSSAEELSSDILHALNLVFK